MNSTREEEAVHTYTIAIDGIEQNKFEFSEKWKNMEAPIIAKRYWRLDDKSTLLDVVKCIRLDEAHHRSTNHA